MNKHLSVLAVSLLAGALVACRSQTLESVARDPEGLVLTYISTDVDETGSWDVIQIENPTATTFQFPGTGPESPDWYHSVETDHGWLRSAGSWCGTGILGNPVAPGASLVRRVRAMRAQPSYARTDVELPPTRELEYLGRVRTGIRVKDLSTGDFSYAWSQTYAVELAEPPGPDCERFAVIREVVGEPK